MPQVPQMPHSQNREGLSLHKVHFAEAVSIPDGLRVHLL